MNALYPYDGPVDGERFLSFLEHHLIPTLRDGDVVVMENLRVHHIPEVERHLLSVGASPLYLPPYSPELNPDELAWNTLKNGIVGRSTVKSKDELKSKVVGGLRKIQKSPEMVRSFFQHEKTKYAA